MTEIETHEVAPSDAHYDTICFLVCYYEKYKSEALRQATDLLRSVGGVGLLVIVNNSVECARKTKSTINTVEINGSNVGGEFSGWDEGVLAINSFDMSKSIVIFCNDTFCFHRPYTWFHRYIFARSIKKLKTSPHSIVGEYNKFGLTFSVNGYESDGWISTYLFAMNGADFHQIGPLDKANTLFDRNHMLVDREKKKILLNEICSETLVGHLTNWFFPSEIRGGSGWYNARFASDHILEMKIRAILNEKLLSCVAISNGLSVVDVYGGGLFRVIAKVLSKVFSAFKY